MIHEFAQGSNSSRSHTLSIQYKEYDERAVELSMYDQFKALCSPLPPECIADNDDTPNARIEMQEQFLIKNVRRSAMTADTKNEFEKLYQQAPYISKKYHQLCAQMIDTQVLDLVLSAEDALRLSLSLSTACKEKLTVQADMRLSALDHTDPLSYALHAFLRIVNADSDSDTSDDKAILDAYANLQATYPSMSGHLSHQLMTKMSMDASISQLSIFGEYGGSYQARLLAFQSEGYLAILRESLASSLMRLYQNMDSNGLSHLSVWEHHAKMAKILLDLPGESAARFKQRLMKIQKLAFSTLTRYLGDGSESCFYLMKHHVSPKHLNKLYRSVLAIRLLGQSQYTQYLSVIMARLVARRRKAMMTMVTDDRTLNFISVVEDLILLGGSARMQQSSQKMLNLWQLATQQKVTTSNRTRFVESSQQPMVGAALELRQQLLIEAMQSFQRDCHKQIEVSVNKLQTCCHKSSLPALAHLLANRERTMDRDELWMLLQRNHVNLGLNLDKPKQVFQLCHGIMLQTVLAEQCKTVEKNLSKAPEQALLFEPDALQETLTAHHEYIGRSLGTRFSRFARFARFALNQLQDYVIQQPKLISVS